MILHFSIEIKLQYRSCSTCTVLYRVFSTVAENMWNSYGRPMVLTVLQSFRCSTRLANGHGQGRDPQAQGLASLQFTCLFCFITRYPFCWLVTKENAEICHWSSLLCNYRQVTNLHASVQLRVLAMKHII